MRPLGGTISQQRAVRTRSDLGAVATARSCKLEPARRSTA